MGLGAVTQAQAEVELENVLADVRRGVWQPPAPEPEPEAPRLVPTFHEFATEWFESRRVEGGRRGGGLTPAGESDLRWKLTNHLLPAFAHKRLDQISVEDVDRFRREKVAESERCRVALAEWDRRRRAAIEAGERPTERRPPRALSVTSINAFLKTLCAIMEVAVEYGHVDRNPARGRRRRLPSVTPRRTFVDRADHVEALLDAAGRLDGERRSARFRRPLLATLVLAGLRIDEALSLRWRHVDLAAGAIHVPGTKSEAALRTVDMLPLLRDELLSWAATDREADGLVFGTSTGAKQSASNIRNRVLADAVELANNRLADAGLPALPEGLTPHSLRRTFASILVARGEDPAYVMQQMGHTDPKMTLGIYARAMQRRDGEKERLRALVDGTPIGHSGHAAGFGRDKVAETQVA